MNRKGKCPAQYENRFQLMIERYGGNLCSRQLDKEDGSLRKWLSRTYGSFNEAKEEFKLKITPKSEIKEKANLIYDLRNYVKEYFSLPWDFSRKSKGNKRENNFPHSLDSYLNKWGSMNKSLRHCGVKKGIRIIGNQYKKGKYKWEVIE